MRAADVELQLELIQNVIIYTSDLTDIVLYVVSKERTTGKEIYRRYK